MATKKFQDPTPEQTKGFITFKPSDAETALIEKYDPLSPDLVKNIAGLIVRSAVDISRYERSAVSHPEKAKHYKRLIDCAVIQVSRRLCYMAAEKAENSTAFIAELETELEKLPWSSARATHKPRISVAVPADGTEWPYGVQFIAAPSYQRSQLPA